MTAFQSDLVIQNEEGFPVALIEVTNPRHLSLDTAMEIHRYIMERGLLGYTPYFLLLSQDKGYLWKNTKNENPDSLPDYEFSMEKVVNRYMKDLMGQRLYTEVLEFLVLQWLTIMAGSETNSGEEPENILAESGFNDSIKGASVLFGKIG